MLLGHVGLAQGHGLGLGLMIGEPTGISCKGWVTNSGAIQLGIGWRSTSHTGGRPSLPSPYGIRTFSVRVNLFPCLMDLVQFLV